MIQRIDDLGWREAGLDPRRRAILTYCEKLTTTPSAIERGDVDALRAAGLDDRDILGVAECAAYYAYANRLADGLGIQLEPWFEDPTGQQPDPGT